MSGAFPIPGRLAVFAPARPAATPCTTVTRYGILDDFGEVIRWQWEKPASHYRYITERIKRPKRRPPIDWSNFEPAPF